MPRNRIAWSSWNYLSFTEPVQAGKVKDKRTNVIDLDGKKARAEVNQVSL